MDEKKWHKQSCQVTLDISGNLIKFQGGAVNIQGNRDSHA